MSSSSDIPAAAPIFSSNSGVSRLRSERDLRIAAFLASSCLSWSRRSRMDMTATSSKEPVTSLR